MADNLADRIPRGLKEAQRTGNLVVFAGAGVSQPPPSDLPGFSKLCKMVSEHYCVKPRDSNETPTQYLNNIANYAQNQEPALKQFVREKYSDSKSRPNKLHRMLVQLFAPNHELALVTTNYDEHLVTAARVLSLNPHIHCYPSRTPRWAFEGIYFAHGNVTQEPKYLVVTEDDFDKAYVAFGDTLESLRDIFNRFTVLFFGYGLEDPFVDRLHRHLSPVTSPRFAIVDSAKVERFEQLNINPIEYQLVEGDEPHAQAASILAAWIDEIHQEDFSKSSLSPFGG